jgi:hypothetical protein
MLKHKTYYKRHISKKRGSKKKNNRKRCSGYAIKYKEFSANSERYSSKSNSLKAIECNKVEVSPKGKNLYGWIAYGITLLLKGLVIKRVFPMFYDSIELLCAMKVLEWGTLDEIEEGKDVFWWGKYLIFGFIEIITNVVFDMTENRALIAIFFAFAFIAKKILFENYSELYKKILFIINLLPLTCIMVVLIKFY